MLSLFMLIRKGGIRRIIRVARDLHHICTVVNRRAHLLVLASNDRVIRLELGQILTSEEDLVLVATGHLWVELCILHG